MLRKIGNLCLCIIFIGAALYAMLTYMGGQKKLELYFADNEITEVELSQISRSLDDSKYYYCNIPSNQKRAYAEVFYILKTFDTEREVSVDSKEELNKVLTCVLNDYPDIFYIDGYSYNLSGKNKIIISPSYTYSREEVDIKQGLIDNYTDTCLSQCPDTDDQYYILKYIYDYIINHTNYNTAASDNQSMCSVMINGVSVCQGYAKTMQYLLEQKDIEAIFITGKTTKGINHAWLEVNINGEWYCCDPTWGDAKFNTGSISDNSVNYDCMLTSTEEFSQTHLIDNVADVPMCYSMADNYYVKEGYYINGYDRDKVMQLYEAALEDGNHNFFFKCADKDTYENASLDLIDSEGIFAIITDENAQVSYSEFPKQRELIFWF